MKKQMTFVLGVFMIFSLAACGTQTEAEENEAEDVAEIPSEEQNAQADRNTDNTESKGSKDYEKKYWKQPCTLSHSPCCSGHYGKW